MSEKDMTQAASSKSPAEKEAVNTSPYLKKKTDDKPTEASSHGYFIPAVITLVLGVIIVTAFFNDSVSNMMAGFDSAAPVEESAADAASDQAGPAISPTNEGITVTSDQPGEMNTTIASAKSGNTAQKVVSPALAGNIYNRYGFGYPGYPRTPYAMPESHEKAYREMLQRRRQAYEEAMQKRHEHLQQMHKYRTAVFKRIDKDREDLYKRMYELDLEARRIRAESMQRHEDFRAGEPRWPM